MTLAPFALTVRQHPDPEAERILAELAPRVGRKSLVPDDHGKAWIVMTLPSGADSWDVIREALDETDDDWESHLHMPGRPDR